MSARDDLADLLVGADDTSWEMDLDCPVTNWWGLAAAVIAAGWRPPARRIETVEELDALPDMAIIRDCLGNVLEAAVHDQDGLIEWWATGSDDDDYPVTFPAWVVWEPGDGDE